MAITTRGKRQDAPDVDENAEIKAAIQTVARFAANVAAQAARGPWTDFRQLHREQYNGTPEDIERLAEILAGRKP